MDSKASPRRSRARIREQQALELRLAGRTYAQIGEALGVTVGGAYQMVKRSLARIEAKSAETAAELLRLDLERLDTMLRAIWPRVEAGEEDVIPVALRILERRAKMVGYEHLPPQTLLSLDLTSLPDEALQEIAGGGDPLTVAARYRKDASSLSIPGAGSSGGDS